MTNVAIKHFHCILCDGAFNSERVSLSVKFTKLMECVNAFLVNMIFTI